MILLFRFVWSLLSFRGRSIESINFFRLSFDPISRVTLFFFRWTDRNYLLSPLD